MPDKTLEEAQRALETTDELEGSFTLKGEEYPLEVHEPTLNELEDLEAGLNDAADEVEAMREMTDKYLIAPDTDAGRVGISKLRALFDGMREAWEDGKAFDEAQDAMPIDEGNGRRRNSRR